MNTFCHVLGSGLLTCGSGMRQSTHVPFSIVEGFPMSAQPSCIARVLRLTYCALACLAALAVLTPGGPGQAQEKKDQDKQPAVKKDQDQKDTAKKDQDKKDTAKKEP